MKNKLLHQYNNLSLNINFCIDYLKNLTEIYRKRSNTEIKLNT
jgi:hypothetical protein